LEAAPEAGLAPAREDRVLYFLLPDRFSDNSERDYLDVNGKAVQTGTTRRFDRKADFENAIQTAADAQRWRDAGGVWVRSNLKGVTSKLGYLPPHGCHSNLSGTRFQAGKFSAHIPRLWRAEFLGC
jgi:hypothetical protein